MTPVAKASANAKKPAAMTVAEMARIVASMDADAFGQIYGDGFLLQRGTAKDERPKWAKFGTIAVSADAAKEANAPIAAKHMVFSIPKEGRPPFLQWVTVGRIPRNVIVIDHSSVSKLHAMIRFLDGSHRVSDAGSKNGTTVNGRDVARYDRGDPVALKPGDRLMIGAVTLMFFGPKELWKLLRDWNIDG